MKTNRLIIYILCLILLIACGDDIKKEAWTPVTPLEQLVKNAMLLPGLESLMQNAPAFSRFG